MNNNEVGLTRNNEEAETPSSVEGKAVNTVPGPTEQRSTARAGTKHSNDESHQAAYEAHYDLYETQKNCTERERTAENKEIKKGIG